MHPFEIATIVLTACTVVLGWLQYQAAKTKKASAIEVIPHSSLKLYLKRERVAKELIEIANRTSRGEVLFGSCKTCGNYPPEVHSAIARAVGRGAVIKFIVSNSDDSSDFVSFLRGLNPSQVSFKKRGGDYLRMCGIKGKEVLLAFPRTDVYIGLHVLDNILVGVLGLAFEGLWNMEAP